MAIKVSLGRLQVDLPELEHQVPLQASVGCRFATAICLRWQSWRPMESIAIHLIGCWCARAGLNRCCC
jgi:hypothetical protein